MSNDILFYKGLDYAGALFSNLKCQKYSVHLGYAGYLTFFLIKGKSTVLNSFVEFLSTKSFF